MRFLSFVLTSLLVFVSTIASSQDQVTQIQSSKSVAADHVNGNDATIYQSGIIGSALGAGRLGSAYLMSWLYSARKHGLEYIPGLKKMAFELSLRDVIRTTKEPRPEVSYRNDRWNVIVKNDDNGAKIILGMIPLREYNHHLTLVNDYQVRAVVSLLENFELEPGWFNTPVSAQEWRSHGVSHYRVITADFDPLSIEKISDAVGHIQSHWEKGETVYVHCKAGVGRSATAVAAWLSLYRLQGSYLLSFPDDASLEQLVDDVVADILLVRMVNLHSAQKNAIVNFLKSLRPRAKTTQRNIKKIF